MVRFEHINLLYALFLIPLLAVVFRLMLRWRKKALALFGEKKVISKLIYNTAPGKAVTKFILLMMALAFLILGLSNPQVGSKLVEGERKGIDIMIALDVSTSMLAEDIKPNRLEKAKQSISRLIDQLSNDRIGIIVFAGKAYTQLPITTDYAAAKMFLSTINTNIVPVQGTAIGEAINLAVSSFDDQKHSKAIIIISDGENHEDDAARAAAEAAEAGIRIYTIGMGQPEGSPIPAFDQFNRKTGYKKDRQGNTVVTKLNEIMLQQIASAGNGVYVRATSASAGLQKIFDEVNKLEKTEYESKMFSDYEARFQYFIAPAILLLILELLMFDRKSRIMNKIKIFDR
ncbi:MAG: VWA domain-containing protein [Bacteroidales bacterium]|nr:VWA domain-containing protein [Bacteroidales bacterium]